MAAQVIDTQKPNQNDQFPLNSQELLAFERFSSSFRIALQNRHPPVTGLEKEIRNLIIDELFPDLLNNPVTHKKNMELIHLTLIIALHERVFLEFLFTQRQLKQIQESLERYQASLMKTEGEKQQNIQLVLLNEAQRRLQAQRIDLILEAIRQQTHIYNLRSEIRGIYMGLGGAFKNLYNDYAKEHLLHPDPKHEINLSIPGVGEISVNHNSLISHVGEYVGDKIARQKVKIEREAILREIDNAVVDFTRKQRPDLDKDVIVNLPEEVKSKIEVFVDQGYLKNDWVVSEVARAEQKKNELNEQQAKQDEFRINLINKNAQEPINDPQIAQVISEMKIAQGKNGPDQQIEFNFREIPFLREEEVSVKNKKQDQAIQASPVSLANAPDLNASNLQFASALPANDPKFNVSAETASQKQAAARPGIFRSPQKLNPEKIKNNELKEVEDKKENEEKKSEDDEPPHFEF